MPNIDFRRTLSLLVLFLVVFIAGGLTFYAALISQHEEPTDLDYADAYVEPDADLTESIETIFFPLERKAVSVPADRRGYGGGLTNWGGSVVVLTHYGKLYRIAEDTSEPLNIELPDNGFAAYEAYVGQRQDLFGALIRFRFNDIEYIEGDGVGRLLASYTYWDSEDECYTNAVSSISALPEVGAVLGEWQQIYAATPCIEPPSTGIAMHGHMAGGRMVVLGNNKIALANGDYGLDGGYDDRVVAQSVDYEFGKIVEIDIGTGEARLLSAGHSNPQGIVLDNTGHLWAVEHGRRGGDELNLIVEGANFGWPHTSLGTRYNKLPLPLDNSYGRHSDAYDAPRFAWLPSIAPSSIDQVQAFSPEWDGDLIVGGLISRSLFRLRLRDDRVLFSEEIPIGRRTRDILSHPDGFIAIWTDDHVVEFLRRGKKDHTYELAEALAESIEPDEVSRAQLLRTLDACVECHSLGINVEKGVPSLGRVYGADIASQTGVDYSQGLLSVAGQWDEANLERFLKDPQTFAPGNFMPKPEFSSPQLRSQIIKLLKHFAEDNE